MASSYFAFSWIGLIFTGFAVLWSLQIIYRGERSRVHGSQLPLLINTIGWLLVLAGILGPLVMLSVPLAIVLIPVVLIFAAMAMQRFRMMEFRMLNRQLALALEKGISLERVARSFAIERTDEVGDRSEHLAQGLAEGIPLETALRRARIPMPFELRMAASLPASSPQHPRLSQDTDVDLYAGMPLMVDSLRQLWYLTAVVLAGASIIVFVFIKIMPTFQVIFDDFQMQLPPLTRLVVGNAARVAQYGIILAPLLLILLLATLAVSLYYIGWLTWEPYPISRLRMPNHSRRILRTVADQIDLQRPLPEAVELIADSYPTRHVRQRLRTSADKIRAGVHWCAALQQSGLIDRATKDVLESAERLGNLPWALREMAEGRFRRHLRRVSAALRILEPTIILLFAAVVAIMCLAVMTPLANLIKALT